MNKIEEFMEAQLGILWFYMKLVDPITPQLIHHAVQIEHHQNELQKLIEMRKEGEV